MFSVVLALGALFSTQPTLVEQERHVITVDARAVKDLLRCCNFTLQHGDLIFVPTKTTTVALYIFTATRSVSSDEVITAFSAHQPPLRPATVIEVLLHLDRTRLGNVWRWTNYLRPIVTLGAFRHHPPDLEKKYFPVVMDPVRPENDKFFSAGSLYCPVWSYPLDFRWERSDEKSGELVYRFAAVPVKE